MKRRFPALTTFFITAAWLGCAPNYPELPVYVQQGLACNTIDDFGNGERCGTEEGLGLEPCGPEGACAEPGLCVDASRTLACTCYQDSDCEGWAEYVNSSLGLTGNEIWAPRCFGGGCIFSPESPPAEEESDGAIAERGQGIVDAE